MNDVCKFIKDYIHLNFNEDYSTLIEEKGNIIKYLNEGKFDIYIKH